MLRQSHRREEALGKYVPAVLETRPSGTELAGKAWRSLREAFAAMPLFYFGAFLIYSLAVVGPIAITGYLTSATTEAHSLLSQTVFSVFTLFLPSVLSLGAVAVAAVATHRFILLDDRCPKFERNALQFFLWLLFLAVIFSFLETIKVFEKKAMPDSGFTDIFGGAIWITKVTVAVHFVLLFPSVAVGEQAGGWRDRIETSWRRMTGNFWIFLGGDIVAVFPIVLVLLLGMLLSLALFRIMHGQDFSDSMRLWGTSAEIFRDLIGFWIMMIQAAIASWLYAWVRQQPKPALEQSSDIMPS